MIPFFTKSPFPCSSNKLFLLLLGLVLLGCNLPARDRVGNTKLARDAEERGTKGVSAQASISRNVVKVAISKNSLFAVRSDGLIQEVKLSDIEQVGSYDSDSVFRKKCEVKGDELPVMGAAFSRSGKLVAVSMRGVIQVWSTEDCSKIAETSSVDSRVGTLEFSPDDRSLVFGAFDGKVYRWRFGDLVSFHNSSPILFERYIGHAGLVSSLVMHPGGRVIFSGDWSGLLKAWLRYDEDEYRGKWDVVREPGRFYTEVSVSLSAARLSHSIDNLAISSDGERLFSATRDGSIQLWSVRGFLMRGQAILHNSQLRDLAVDESGELVATVGRDNIVKVVKVDFTDKDRKKAVFLPVNQLQLAEPRLVVFSSDRKLLSIADREINVLSIGEVR